MKLHFLNNATDDALGLVIFSCFLYKPMKNMCPRGGAIFDHRGTILNKLGRGPLGDATCQISRL